MPLDKSMFENNLTIPMGLGDFEAKQRALKKQDRRRKSECTERMRQTQFAGLSQTYMQMAAIKKDLRKSEADAAKHMHENLSKESQGLPSHCLKEKAMKEEARQKKQIADEMNRSYRGGLRDEDLKLTEMKREERMKKQAVDELNHGYKGGVAEQDLRLSEIKKEARKKEQDAANFNHESLSGNSQALDTHFLREKATKEEERQKKLAASEMRQSYKGVVSEVDTMLAEIKKEDRMKKQAVEELNRGYKGGIAEQDLKLAEIKKDARKKEQDAVNFNHEPNSLSLGTHFLIEKAMKEEERQQKHDADEIMRSYKGGVSKEDKRLAEMKKEERLKKQAASELNQHYKGEVKESDLRLTEIKKEEREKKQAADQINHSYGGISAAVTTPVLSLFGTHTPPQCHVSNL